MKAAKKSCSRVAEVKRRGAKFLVGVDRDEEPGGGRGHFVEFNDYKLSK